MNLLKSYVWKRQTASQLAHSYGKSERWVRDKIKSVTPQQPNPRAVPTICILDVTFFARDYGILICRDPHRKKNIHWQEVPSETTSEYRKARTALEAKGVSITAVVIDGRKGVRELFTDVPVQICQFHQIKAVTTYLTRKPKLQAGQELRLIALGLTKLTEQEFTTLLAEWHEKWELFLKERTIDPTNSTRWFYTHKRVRSAYYSLKRNLPYLFTYQRYPELNIPNTTNALDGYIKHLKSMVAIHSGIRKTKRYILLSEILAR